MQHRSNERAATAGSASDVSPPSRASARPTVVERVVEGVIPSEGGGVVLAIFLEDEIAYLMSEGVLRAEEAATT